MPPLAKLPAPRISTGRKIGLTALRTYLLITMVLVIIRIVQLALATDLPLRCRGRRYAPAPGGLPRDPAPGRIQTRSRP
jgi:hypothetical protein